MDSASAPILTIEFLCLLLQYILRLVRCELHLYPYPQLFIELSSPCLGLPKRRQGWRMTKGCHSPLVPRISSPLVRRTKMTILVGILSQLSFPSPPPLPPSLSPRESQ